jgi:glycosyltransferase involved in cell wall biosynthesis
MFRGIGASIPVDENHQILYQIIIPINWSVMSIDAGQNKGRKIAVVIPTYNSAMTLPKTFDSLKQQTYQDFHVIVVDSNSKDNTKKLAEEFGATIIDYPGKTLGARREGIKAAQAEYYLLLDSDQVLEESTLKKCVDGMNGVDYLVLEEHTYRNVTFVERLFEADRNLIHADVKHYMEQTHGILCPRFFRGSILRTAFDAIPEDILAGVQAYDDAILTFEVRKITERGGLIPDAVRHMEPSNLRTLWRKNLKYGRSARKMVRKGYYPEVFRAGVRLRTPLKGMYPEFVSSMLLLILKAVPYQLGYLTQSD